MSRMRHVLFLCSRHRLRSPTAAAVFADHPGWAVDSAGLADDADTPLAHDQVARADLIVVMEASHRRRLQARFGGLLKGKRVCCLGIPDRYDFMQPELVELLRRRVGPLLR